MVIAKRILKFQQSGNVIDIPIIIFMPERGDRSSWKCRYEIGWPDKKREMTAFGADSMQALILAIEMVATDIYTSSQHDRGGLSFERPGRGYGFPLPLTLRHLLEGDDAEYF